MAKTDLNTLKNWFKTGLKPTQTHFWNWLDSFRHKDDTIPVADVEGLEGSLNAKANNSELATVAKTGDYEDLENKPANLFLGIFTSLTALETAHPTAIAGNSANVDQGTGNDAVRYIWDVDDAEWVKSGGNHSTDNTGSSSKQIEIVSSSLSATTESLNKIYRFKGVNKQYFSIPFSSTPLIPIGTSIILKQAGDGGVNMIAGDGVVIETSEGYSLEINDKFDYVELVHEELNVWGLAGALKPISDYVEPQIVISADMLSIDSLYWPKLYKSSEWPEFTTTKDYFTIYSTDHDVNGGGCFWAECDDIYYSNLVEKGTIVSGYQAETPWLIRVPIADSGISDEIFLYYHSQSEPGNPITQSTRLMTTSGGDEIHLSTWTDRGYPVSLEPGDNHNGYLRLYKVDGVYRGRCLRTSTASGQAQIVSGTNPLNLTRERTVELYEPFLTGSYNSGAIQQFERNGIQYGYFMYDKGDGETFLSLATLDVYGLPDNLIINVASPQQFGELRVEGDTAYYTARNESNRTEYFMLEFDLIGLI